jgi:hypothetical protein
MTRNCKIFGILLVMMVAGLTARGSVVVTVNGSNYTIPQTNEKGWGANVTTWIQAISANSFQPIAGNFSLLNDADFGSSFGLKAVYYKSRSANLSTVGLLRMANTDSVGWRNVGNTANYLLAPGSIDGILGYGGVDLVGISQTQTLTNKTLTSPVINTPTGIVKGDVGLGLVDNTSDATKNAAAVTLTNKTMSGASNTFSNIPAATAITGQLPVANGGTGLASTTAYGVLLGGTTTTGVLQNAGAGSAGQVLTSSGPSAVPTWVTSSTANNSYILQNLGVASSVATSAMTIALKQADGATDPTTAPSDVKIGFRSSTAASGAFNIRSATAATSIVIPASATLGQASALNQYVWLYALDNAGTVELAVSGVNLFADNTIQSTTAISAAATSGSVLYSTTARTNVPIRLIGRLLVNETTAGTWAANATDVTTSPKPVPNITDWVAWTPTFTGFGTPTSVAFYSRRNGDSLQINGSFTAGTTTAVEARLSLGYLGVDSNVTSSGATKIGNTIDAAGDVLYASAAAVIGYTTIQPSVGYLTFGLQGASNGALTKVVGSTALATGGTVSISAQVPILGWSTYGP